MNTIEAGAMTEVTDRELHTVEGGWLSTLLKYFIGGFLAHRHGTS